MNETLFNKALLILGLQLPLFLGITAWLARRDGIKLDWFRIGGICIITLLVISATLAMCIVIGSDSRNTLVFSLMGATAVSTGVAWFAARQSRKKKTEQSLGALPHDPAGRSDAQG